MSYFDKAASRRLEHLKSECPDGSALVCGPMSLVFLVATDRAMIDRLFVYGALAPGRPNEHVLAEVPGTWEPATVRGTLLEAGWGAQVGYPGIVLDELAGEVSGFIFSSDVLDNYWIRLDHLEGSDYERVMTMAKLQDGTLVEAHIDRLSRNRNRGS